MVVYMNLRILLDGYSKGKLSIDELQRRISIQSVEQVANNVAQLDINREIRKEIPEVIFGKGKEYTDLLKITRAAARKNGIVVVSKIQSKELLVRLCRGLKKIKLEVEVGKKSKTMLVSTRSHGLNSGSIGSSSNISSTTLPYRGKIGILAAGTSDIGIAEEARLMAKAMGCATLQSYDVGIAGIHRLFPALTEMMSENVGAIVVVAGMEGALASVVTSMVNVPVVGVPTSVGYGFGSDGIAALASMLQSCTPGLSVVNIDNGIGAGAFAALISNQLARTTAAPLPAPKGTARERETRIARRMNQEQQQKKNKEKEAKDSHKKSGKSKNNQTTIH